MLFPRAHELNQEDLEPFGWAGDNCAGSHVNVINKSGLPNSRISGITFLILLMHEAWAAYHTARQDNPSSDLVRRIGTGGMQMIYQTLVQNRMAVILVMLLLGPLRLQLNPNYNPNLYSNLTLTLALFYPSSSNAF